MDLGIDLAVLGIVWVIFFGTRLTGTGAGFGHLWALVGVASHESGVHRRGVCDVATEPSSLSHPLVAETLVRTPLTAFSGFTAYLDALTLFLARMTALEGTVSASDITRHRTWPVWFIVLLALGAHLMTVSPEAVPECGPTTRDGEALMTWPGTVPQSGR